MVDTMSGDTRLYGAPHLTSQLVERATEGVQGSSSNNRVAADVMIVLVQNYTKLDQLTSLIQCNAAQQSDCGGTRRRLH